MNTRESIIQDFKNYMASRTGFWGIITTFLFRDEELTTLKVALASVIIEKLEDKKNSDEVIKEQLIEARKDHVKISVAKGKRHLNFCPHRVTKHSSERDIEDIHSHIACKEGSVKYLTKNNKQYPLYKNPHYKLCMDAPTHYLYGAANEEDFKNYSTTQKGHTVISPYKDHYFFSQGFYARKKEISKNRSYFADVLNNAIAKLGKK